MNLSKIFFTILLLSTIGLNAQKIDWMSFEDAIKRNKEFPRNILIDVYTNWCGYCKKMDRDTYENAVIANYINQNFYAVKLDAEQKESIQFMGKEFKFVASGRKGYHELAAGLLDGEMSYPSTVFMNSEMQVLQKIPGYLSAEDLEPILTFFSDEIYLENSWESFKANFNSQL